MTLIMHVKENCVMKKILENKEKYFKIIALKFLEFLQILKILKFFFLKIFPGFFSILKFLVLKKFPGFASI